MQALVEAGLPVAAVISNRADAGGLDFARSRNIATAVVDHASFASREAFDDALAREIDPHRPRACCARSTSSIRARRAGFSRTSSSSRMPWCELKEMMRNWCWLLISLAGAAAAEPPARVELVFALTRNGSTMAEVVERLEYAS